MLDAVLHFTVGGVLSQSPCAKCKAVPDREDTVYVPIGNPPRMDLVVCTACALGSFAPETWGLARRERAATLANEVIASNVRSVTQAVGVEGEVVIEMTPVRVPLAVVPPNGADPPVLRASSVHGEVSRRGTRALGARA